MILATYDGTPQAGSANSDSLGHRLHWVCRPGVVGDASTSGEVWPGDDAHACTGGFSNGAIRDDVGARPRRDAAGGRFGADFTLAKLDESESVQLSALTSKEPVVLVFGSYT